MPLTLPTAPHCLQREHMILGAEKVTSLKGILPFCLVFTSLESWICFFMLLFLSEETYALFPQKNVHAHQIW